MKRVQNIIYSLIILLSFILIITFKSIPSGQLWKNYNILYVPSETPDSLVLSAFEKTGIDKAISLSKQYLPVLYSEHSPEISLYKLYTDSDEFSYIKKRVSFFYDKSNNYRLYYIPVENKQNLSKCISFLNSQNVNAGSDSSASYPWLLPVICCLVAIILIYFCKNKIIFSFTLLLPILFIFCNPFYPAAIANIILQLILFFTSNVWGRKKVLNYLLSNKIIILMLLISLITPFSCSIKSGIFYILCLASVYSTFYLYDFVKIKYDSYFSFVPVYIRPAKMIPLFARKQKVIMPIVTAAAFLIILFFVLTSSDTINSHFAKLQLPSSEGIISENLPDLNDYTKWSWNVKTLPYKSLNNNSDSNTIYFSHFENKNEKISESIQSLSFDENFIEDSYKIIDNLPYESIEKLLKTQKPGTKPGYSSTNSYHIGIFGIIMMLFCLFVLLFLYISIIIRKGVKK